MASRNVACQYGSMNLSWKVGDRLRESIDSGLSQSRFGIVVLSPHFFAKTMASG